MQILSSVLCGFAVFLASTLAQELASMNEKWQAWKEEHGKRFTTEQEETRRLEVWMNNLAVIEEHNRQNHSYTLAMNHFGDLVYTHISYCTL